MQPKKAKRDDLKMVITVANPAENLVGRHRTEDTWPASANTADIAAVPQVSTHRLATLTHSGESLWDRQTTGENRLVAFGGGYPLEVDGEIGGTVSVAGGETVQDVAVTEADIERFDELAGGRP